MALLNLGDDPWLLEHESCEKLHRDIMEQLSLRQREPRSTEKYAHVSATIRLRLKQYNNEVGQLKQKSDQAARVRSITLEETERRTRQIEILQSKSIQMQKIFDDHNMNMSRDRSTLLGPAGVSSWDSDDEQLVGGEASQYTVEQLRTHQQRMLEDQDQGLESLSKIISRQKNIAHTISTEVDLHNEIIDDLGDHIDRTDARVTNETRTIGTIDRKDKTCIYWVVIILLFISIIAVVAV